MIIKINFQSVNKDINCKSMIRDHNIYAITEFIRKNLFYYWELDIKNRF